MPHYLCRLNPPRPSFATDMSEDELRLMQQHGAYWGALLDGGPVVIFGLVAEPPAPWGMCVLDVDDEDKARALTADDPAIRADAGFTYDVFEMPNAISRRGR